MLALIGALGATDAGRFVTLALREPFDYTEWRKGLFEGETIESLHEQIVDFQEKRKLKQPVS